MICLTMILPINETSADIRKFCGVIKVADRVVSMMEFTDFLNQ